MRIGIDAGSKTVKLVVIDDEGEVVHALYRRHASNIRRTLLEVLDEYLQRFGNVVGPAAVTGSAGIAVAQALGLPFVQEVVATTDAVRQAYPQANAIIELGGEDAKVVYLDEPVEQRMNATCAGGTGGFIDTFAAMMGIRASEVNLYAMRAEHVYPVSQRCAVFAAGDVRPLLAAGASKEDIAASVLEAVVRQTVGGLACGRPIRGNVVFLGGPLEFIPELYRRFCVALELDRETGIKPHRANLFTARGAAIGAGRAAAAQREAGAAGASCELSVALLRRAVAEMPEVRDELERLEPLFADGAERAAFERRHAASRVPRAPLSAARGPVFLGIDAGSTAVKYALVDERGALLAGESREAAGDALLVAGRMVEGLYERLGEGGRVRIARTVITGSDDELVGSALKADAHVSGMTAFVRAVRELCPDATLAVDAGGQDIAGMWLKDGALADAVTNEPCSSGCGAFVSEAAASFSCSLSEFTDAALAARRPVELDTKCTVFMNSRVRHAQKAGAGMDDISAGVAYSVARNVLYRVIARAENPEMGERVVVGGGAFASDAVLRAFEKSAGIEVVRPDEAQLMGALGAALVARDEVLSGAGAAGGEGAAGGAAKSTLVDAEYLAGFDPVYSAWRCQACADACMLSIVDFGTGRVFVSGNRCSKGPRAVRDEMLRIGADEYLGTTSLLPRSGSRARPKSSGDIGDGIRVPGFLKVFGGGMNGGGPSQAGESLPDYVGAARRAEALVSFSTREMRAEGSEVPNCLARQRELLGAYATREGSGPRAAEKIGIVNTLASYRMLPFWHTLLSRLGYSVLVADGAEAAALRTDAAESIPSESVCEPAKITHERVYELARLGARAVFMPRFERGASCAVACSYASVIADNVPFVADGFVKLLSPLLGERDAAGVAGSAADVAALVDALGVLDAPAPGMAQVERALAAAAVEQAAFEEKLAASAREALSWVHADTTRQGVVVAGRPYHADAQLAHDIDNVLHKRGVAVLAADALPAGADAGADAELWPHARHLLRAARFAAADPQLDLVACESFGCGYDAAGIEDARRVLDEAGRPFTVLKIDDITDAAHVARRLESLVESYDPAARAVPAPCALSGGAGAGAREGAGARAGRGVELLAGGLSREDVDEARASVPQDLCFTAAVVIARAFKALRADPQLSEMRVPRICVACLLDVLPQALARRFGRVPRIVGTGAWEPPVAVPPVPQAAPDGPASPDAAVRVGIVGNPLLCFDEFMNDGAASLIASLGARPVLPDPALIDVDDVRYLDQLAAFSKAGVSCVLYLQSFGCLKGHVQARGALHELRRRFPEMPVTVLDYDPESSALNRENRIRLVVAAAQRRAAAGPKLGGLPARFRRASCIELIDEYPFYRNTRSKDMERMRNPYGAGAAGTPDYETLKEASQSDRKISPEMAAAIRAVMLRGR